jgi:sterol desaturase/sphingolipid hydroxylase (fatty acid hydroxylase superfamily)
MFTEESCVHPSVVGVQVLLFAVVADFRHSLLHKDRKLFGKIWSNPDHHVRN